MPKLYSGAEIVFKCLEDQNVSHIFGYPGGAVLPIYDELKNFNSIKHILVRHEQGAGHAAEGYARSTGKPGVLLVTSGPGATNAVTALTDAYMDSVPLVCITGQVPTHLIGTDAFQECDTTGITRPCTKHNWLVKDVNDLAEIMHKAFEVATTGRPGPVVLDVPFDIFKETAASEAPNPALWSANISSRCGADPEGVIRAVDMLLAAKKPAIVIGQGVRYGGATMELRALSERLQIPVASCAQSVTARQPRIETHMTTPGI